MKINNIFREWQNANKKLLSASAEEYEITVQMGSLNEAAGDVLNLCYLYPLAYSLYELGKISAEKKLKVNIIFPNGIDQEQSTEQIFRIKMFLKIMQLKDYIALKVDSKFLFAAKPDSPISVSDDLPELSDTGRLFPLYEVTADFDQLQRGLESSYPLLRRSLSELQGHCDLAAFPFYIIVQSMYRFIENDDVYKGNAQRRITADQKEELRKQLTNEVDLWSKEISILALAIWLMLLRDLIETKQLILLPQKGKPSLEENLLNKSRMDAITYGEAMFQLIENSCLHSDGKRAWFGFRMHKVQISSGTAGSRNCVEHVIDRYKKCFSQDKSKGFDEKVSHLFEFFVIDCAYLQEGMTGHFNETVFQTIKEPATSIIRAKQGYESYTPPKNRRDSKASTPEWQAAEKAVFSKDSQLRTYLEHISDLFELEIRTGKKHYMEDLSEHYGLRLLRKIISINNGYLQGYSPYKMEETQYYFDGQTERSQESSYVTLWSALLPLQYNWKIWSISADRKKSIEILDNPTDPPRECLMYLNTKSLPSSRENSSLFRNRTKLDDIKESRKALAQYLNETNHTLSTGVLVLEPGETLYELEIFVKSLFCQLADLLYDKKSPPSLRIAILLPNISRVHEFVRLFSILYAEDKKDMLFIMRSVQIALCVKSSQGIEPIYVECILAGEYLSTTYEIARLFIYHYPEHTLDSLPILSYLIPRQNADDQASELDSPISLFPFDLFLSKEMFASSKCDKERWVSNLFLDRTERILRTDMQKPTYGCLIRNTHVRLGSKIHIDRFYEAELLFHNTGNIARFAYMIVRDLLYGSNKLVQNEGVLLLGYEKYSAPLMIQIERWLRDTHTFSYVCTAIIHDFGERNKEVRFQPLFQPGNQEISATTQVVSVLPVGTTLSTIYKLHNTAKREYPGLAENDFAHNYSIVLIGNQTDGQDNSLSPVTQRYWQNHQISKHLVTVQPECYDGKKAFVRYMMRVDGDWQPPESCELCRNDSNPLPILDVKHSETLPAAIFLLENSHQGRFLESDPSQKSNSERLAALYKHVHYSHICSGNNHFQFFIDFQDLFAENKEKINEYFRTVSIDPNAFHVLVSPLQISNSSIADAVIRHVFGGCSRFLYFNIADAYREEVRTKFSHITQDYLALRRYDPSAKLHIHFVDNSIINGGLISRTRTLMKMLANQATLGDSDVILFDHIFLLVNRSSFDTINAYVQDPQQHLHAYIHLSIPSYNTENDFCPACRLVEKYKLLQKRSSSEMLDAEFFRLIQKHTKRTETEYREILNCDILHSPSYFGWLRQWLHINVINDRIFNILSLPEVLSEKKQAESDSEDVQVVQWLQKRIDEYLEPLFENAEKEKEAMPGKDEEHKQHQYRQMILQKLSEISISDILGTDDMNVVLDGVSVRSVVELVKNHLVSTRDYMRLYSMHSAYEAFENNNTLSSENTPRRLYEETILELIDMKLLNFEQNNKKDEAVKNALTDLSNNQRKQLVFVTNAEWLISYIKVLSRAQLSNYYAYRQAIVSIISTMITMMVAPKDQFGERRKKLENANSKWKKILDTLSYALGYKQKTEDNPIYPLICYQINITLIHRICDLQVHWIVTAKNVENYVNLYMNCLDRIFSENGKKNDDSKKAGLQINLPTEQAAILRYMKALMTATMSSEDDILCLELANIPDILLQSKQDRPVRNDMLTKLAYFIEIENSRMLFSGMYDMETKVSAEEYPTNLNNYRPAENFQHIMQQLNCHVMENIRICYGDTNQVYQENYLLYQNILSNFCRFWHKANKESPYKAPTHKLMEQKGAKEIGQVSYMLQYFLRLKSLSDTQQGMNQISNIPYAYEELCRTICGISGFDMCYIVFRGVGKLPEIIAQSGYYAPYMEEQKILTVTEIDEILVAFRDDSEKVFFSCLPVEDGSQEEQKEESSFSLPCVLRWEKDDRQALIIELAIHDSQHTNDHFYLILHNEKNIPNTNARPDRLSEKQIRSIARNILFMRYTLLEVLTRDYALLANFRYDCTYIRPTREQNDTPAPKILHISDIHAEQKFEKQLTEMIGRKLTKEFRENHPIDLLIISGDIADGSGANASVMEDRYRCVEKLLNKIVMCLWQDSMGYLSHDWRRRVVITTGNHDYASMNQYNAQLDMRTLISGTPVKEETGTMSKFSYFIHFLIRYLDPPIHELLSHDLNEVRNYRRLNLKLLCLNCSSRATPYRTNKVGVNGDIVMSLTKRAMWTEKNGTVSKEKISLHPQEPHRICVAHYSPVYDLSYFRDSYGILPGWVWPTDEDNAKCSPINDLENRFRKIVVKAYALRLEKTEKDEDTSNVEFEAEKQEFLHCYQSMNAAIHALENGEPCPHADAQPFYDHLKSKIPGDKPSFSEEKYRLLKHIRQFYEWIKEENRNDQDETIAQFLKEAAEHIRMGEIDSKCYKELIGDIHKYHPLTVILAGHIHAYSESKLKGDAKEKIRDIPILVSDKLFNEANSNGMNGYLIEFKALSNGSFSDAFNHHRLSEI